MSDAFRPFNMAGNRPDAAIFQPAPHHGEPAIWHTTHEGHNTSATIPATTPSASPAPLPDPVEQARHEGFEQGYAEGHEAGHAEAKAEYESETIRRDALILALQRLDEQAQAELTQRLIATVQAVCEASVLPLALDPAGLAGRAQKAAEMFVRATDERIIRLHPDDLPLVRAMVPDDLTLCADPSLERGALRIETPQGGVEDGPAQWRRAILEALS